MNTYNVSYKVNLNNNNYALASFDVQAKSEKEARRIISKSNIGVEEYTVTGKDFFSVTWCVEDIHASIVSGWDSETELDEFNKTDLDVFYFNLSDDDKKNFCLDVLESLKNNHDCNYGINWDVIKISADSSMDIWKRLIN
ncbi:MULTISPECIES: hypothetical protein [Morganellaceae]|uniref:hypothetical protein n=1 Tax=Morganellaceae TaxID=1903414 RepID=UPI0021FEFDB7|nr:MULTISPECIES: hypothetical protein [Morganellaceae]MDM3780488.1 hypothetical protein [Proteus mirabilis]USR67064.1 hypothetical protein NFC79_20780 [Providencia stuartii]